MSERNEKWLDEQLKGVVDSGKVSFDGEKWKRKYPAEYEELVSRARTRANVQRFLRWHPLIRIAAVIVITTLVVFLVHRQADKHIRPVVIERTEQSSVQMLSVLSLSAAYRRGGLDAVDEQCKKAFEMLRQKNTTVSIADLLNDKNGNKPERKEL